MSSAWGLSWLYSWGNSWGTISVDTHDGAGTAEEYRRYRKKLESMYKAAEARYTKKVIKKSVPVIEIAEKLNLKTPTIAKVAVANDYKIQSIDYSSIQKEIQYIIRYIDFLIERDEQLSRNEMEAEFLILALV